MVTNLPEKAKALWARAQAIKNPEIKLKLLKEFYSSFPKHKGTKKLEMMLKRQIANLEEEVERVKRKRKGISAKQIWVVKKEENLQIAIIGKLESSTKLFNILTRCNYESYEALESPKVGAFKGALVTFQLVLTPFDNLIGEDKKAKIMSIIRNCDIVLIIAESEDYLAKVAEWFEENNIKIGSKQLEVEIKATSSGGIRIIGSSKNCNEKDVVNLLNSYGIKHAIVRINKGATLDDVEDAIFGRIAKDAIVLLPYKSKISIEKFKIKNVIELTKDMNRDKFAEKILELTGLIRVFTKEIGGEITEKPLLVEKGVTVIEIAKLIHKDFAKNFKYARIWRRGLQDKVKVGASFTLQDGDIIEIHA